MKYHPPKCLLNANTTDYPYLEWFGRLLTEQLTWTDQQRAKTPGRSGQTSFKTGMLLWGNISGFTDSHRRFFC